VNEEPKGARRRGPEKRKKRPICRHGPRPAESSPSNPCRDRRNGSRGSARADSRSIARARRSAPCCIATGLHAPAGGGPAGVSKARATSPIAKDARVGPGSAQSWPHGDAAPRDRAARPSRSASELAPHGPAVQRIDEDGMSSSPIHTAARASMFVTRRARAHLDAQLGQPTPAAFSRELRDRKVASQAIPPPRRARS